MITYVRGDLFTSPAHVLVNTVNTVGVMGKGIAREFKNIYPEMFDVYQDACERGELTVGKLLLYRTSHKWILNFPTKRHWRQPSRLEDIEAGLKTFTNVYADMALTSVAFPQLGCGNGELDWEKQVRPLMERYLRALPIDIYIHIYDRGAILLEHHDRKRMKNWLRSQPKSLAFVEFWEDLVAQIDAMTRTGEELVGWTVGISADEHMDQPALSFERVRERYVIAQEDLLDIWQHFRSFGLLAATDLPYPFQKIAPPFLALMARLPYIEQADFAPLPKFPLVPEMATIAALHRDDARGVRLVPPIAPPEDDIQLSLFAEADVA